MKLLLLPYSLAFAFVVVHQAVAVDPPFGQLAVEGVQLVGSDKKAVQLIGMSLFQSNFGEGAPFYTKATVDAIKCPIGMNVVRAAMGVEGGYLTAKDGEKKKVTTVVDAAIADGIYVIIDWHDNNADQHEADAEAFFTEMATTYGKTPNVLYEIWNEPQGDADWSSKVKPYAEKVIAAIRKIDPDNIIIVGTPKWDQDVDIAAKDPIKDPLNKNVMYTLHFYANEPSHQQALRDKANAALTAKLPLFVTEYGTVKADGNGDANCPETQKWWDFLDGDNAAKAKISYVNWSISNKAEGSAAFVPGTTDAKVSSETDAKLTASGKCVYAHNKLEAGKGVTGIKC